MQAQKLEWRGTHGDNEAATVMTYTTGSTTSHPNALGGL